ncbi:hypothetical protein ACFQ07_13825, partial [Actinomadura adrarensis]
MVSSERRRAAPRPRTTRTGSGPAELKFVAPNGRTYTHGTITAHNLGVVAVDYPGVGGDEFFLQGGELVLGQGLPQRRAASWNELGTGIRSACVGAQPGRGEGRARRPSRVAVERAA